MPGDNHICAMRGCNNDRKFEPRKTTNYFSFWNKKSDSSRSAEYFILHCIYECVVEKKLNE